MRRERSLAASIVSHWCHCGRRTVRGRASGRQSLPQLIKSAAVFLEAAVELTLLLLEALQERITVFIKGVVI
jgi:hypothetical protein